MRGVQDTNPMTNPFHSMDDVDWVEQVERRYEFEDQLKAAVAKGDTVGALALWNHRQGDALLKEFHYLIPDDSLQLMREACTIINVLLRQAAWRGGLPPLYLHNISEKFGIMIRNSRDLERLTHEIPLAMIREYAEAVANFSVSHYSELINRTVQLISHRIMNKINSEQLAEELYVSQGHLSRQFKKETGKTIPEYINWQRIEMAKIFLQENCVDITEIAIRLGYQDSSYFSKVFKQVTGKSPRQYLKEGKDGKDR